MKGRCCECAIEPRTTAADPAATSAMNLLLVIGPTVVPIAQYLNRRSRKVGPSLHSRYGPDEVQGSSRHDASCLRLSTSHLCAFKSDVLFREVHIPIPIVVRNVVSAAPHVIANAALDRRFHFGHILRIQPVRPEKPIDGIRIPGRKELALRIRPSIFFRRSRIGRKKFSYRAAQI